MSISYSPPKVYAPDGTRVLTHLSSGVQEVREVLEDEAFSQYKEFLSLGSHITDKSYPLIALRIHKDKENTCLSHFWAEVKRRKDPQYKASVAMKETLSNALAVKNQSDEAKSKTLKV